MASEKDSGLEKAVRSASSDQGRRWSRPWRRESERRPTKERRAAAEEAEESGPETAVGTVAEVAVGAVTWWLEIGRTGGAVEAIVGWLGIVVTV